MYRSTWELDAYVRQHISELADERRSCSSIARRVDRLPSRLTQLQRRLGISLIKVGQALAGYDGVRGLPTSPPHPVTWGSGS
jgi:hypothetical protein